MAWAVFGVGAVLAFQTGATLGEWTAFGVMLLAAFAASDVADKKLNGGAYHCEPAE
jgi:hypothetical protein